MSDNNSEDTGSNVLDSSLGPSSSDGTGESNGVGNGPQDSTPTPVTTSTPTATWNKLNINQQLLNDAVSSPNKSVYIGNRTIDGVTVPIVSIYSGDNKDTIDSPLLNIDKLYMHSNYQYFKIRNVVSVSLTLPLRDIRNIAGGKKSGSGHISYNGYADYYIHQHDYGNPAPAFAIFITDDESNGSLAGQGLTGTLPIQYNSIDTFRLGMCYITENYICIRERYQVHLTQLPEITLKLQIYYFDNQLTVYSNEFYNIVHTPLSLDSINTTATSDVRIIDKTVNFIVPITGQSFNKVLIRREIGSADAHTIFNINGSSTTPFDPLEYHTVDLSTFSTTFSIGFRCICKSSGYLSTPVKYKVVFINTTTGGSVVDYVSGTYTFTSILDTTGSIGLTGRFYSGDFKTLMQTGMDDALPITSAITVPWVDYSNRGTNYGFIGIGYFKPPVDGLYVFYLTSTDTAAIWVGDNALPEALPTLTSAVTYNLLTHYSYGSIQLQANTWYPIRIVHENGNSTNDMCKLEWSGPLIERTSNLIPFFKSPVVPGSMTLLGKYL